MRTRRCFAGSSGPKGPKRARPSPVRRGPPGPAFRVYVYQLLAARTDSPGMAKIYLDKAKAAAKDSGISELAPLVETR